MSGVHVSGLQICAIPSPMEFLRLRSSVTSPATFSSVAFVGPVLSPSSFCSVAFVVPSPSSFRSFAFVVPFLRLRRSLASPPSFRDFRLR